MGHRKFISGVRGLAAGSYLEYIGWRRFIPIVKSVGGQLVHTCSRFEPTWLAADSYLGQMWWPQAHFCSLCAGSQVYVEYVGWQQVSTWNMWAGSRFLP